MFWVLYTNSSISLNYNFFTQKVHFIRFAGMLSLYLWQKWFYLCSWAGKRKTSFVVQAPTLACCSVSFPDELLRLKTKLCRFSVLKFVNRQFSKQAVSKCPTRAVSWVMPRGRLGLPRVSWIQCGPLVFFPLPSCCPSGRPPPLFRKHGQTFFWRSFSPADWPHPPPSRACHPLPPPREGCIFCTPHWIQNPAPFPLSSM